MEYSNLGTTDLRISKISFGCWALGGHGYGVIDDSQSVEAIHKALELGINFFDTADVYGFGHSEKILGKALHRKKDAIITTKFGVSWDANGNTKRNCSVSHLNRSIEQSLKRLKRDYVDLYQLHWYDGVTPVDELMQALLSLKMQGKIRYIGCTNMPRSLVVEANKTARMESAQLIYCLNNLHRQDDIKFFNSVLKMATLVYGVLGRGVFSGKYTVNSKFLKNDTRKTDPNFNEYLQYNLTLLEYVKELSLKYAKTPGQIVTRWVLENNYISSAIIGTKISSQVVENVGALGWIMEEEDKNFISRKASSLFPV